MRLSGKTALITGGTSGIGLATARRFVQEGAKVAVTGRDESKFEDVAKILGDSALIIKAEVRSQADMKKMSGQIKEHFGGLDIYFGNAGRALDSPLDTTDEALYDELMDTNVKGLFFSMQAVARLGHPQHQFYQPGGSDRPVTHGGVQGGGTLAGADLVARASAAQDSRQRSVPWLYQNADHVANGHGPRRGAQPTDGSGNAGSVRPHGRAR